jgi:NADH-quinone oxidoreductase subunit C/D
MSTTAELSLNGAVEAPAGLLDPAWQQLAARFGARAFAAQATRDGIATLWTDARRVRDVLAYLKREGDPPFEMLYDITAIDERLRAHRADQPPADFTVVYHLFSLRGNREIRIKVPLLGEYPSLPSIHDLWANANWYEREIWDMFGIGFDGHPCLRRILMPPTWEGHPLRKEHPARATEMGPYTLPDDVQERELEALRFKPEDWGMARRDGETEFMFLNLGPNHPSVHGVFRIVLQLDGEQIVDCVPDIGYHHRAQEKIGERQTWHSYIPYTDRVDYLGGVMNNLPYVLAVERLAGIEAPPRAQVIRVMLAEFFRIANHLLYYGTLAQDVGALSPVFYMFTDRERVYDIVEAITGFRMHPGWFRIGGVAQDLPQGWDQLVRNFLAYLPPRIDEYDRMVMRNRIFKARTVGIGSYTKDEAVEWGVTGPGLRAAGLDWDLRKQRPYSGYENFQFDIPVTANGDAYDRCVIHIEEMRQSLAIIRQCLENMPAGPIKAQHPLATPPPKERTLHDIETLITHFVNVSWGPVIPPGEAAISIEGTKGNYTYYLVADGNTVSYRTRIRTSSFPHLQMIPFMARGMLLADLVAILGSIDFVMADVDR